MFPPWELASQRATIDLVRGHDGTSLVVIATIQRSSAQTLDDKDLPAPTDMLVAVESVPTIESAKDEGTEIIATEPEETDQFPSIFANSSDDDDSGPESCFVGHMVNMKDCADEQWKVGIVTSVSPLEVRFEFADRGFAWNMVRALRGPAQRSMGAVESGLSHAPSAGSCAGRFSGPQALQGTESMQSWPTRRDKGYCTVL